MGMTKEELFARAKKNREEERLRDKERKENQGTWEDHDPISWVALTENKDQVIRMVGDPPSERTKPTDMKEILVSQIIYREKVKEFSDLTDTSKKNRRFRCIWPERNETGKDWILWRILDLLEEAKWERQGDKNVKIYQHETGPASAFFKYTHLNNTLDSKYPSGWKPHVSVLMNVIDRHDMNWHRENKKTKVLSKKLGTSTTTDGKTLLFYEPGVAKKCYTQIWDEVVEYHGPWENYDIVVRKLEEDPWYRSFHPVTDLIKIQDAAKPFIVQGPMTAEELSWTPFDLDLYFPVTSYTKIMNLLGGFIMLLDRVMGTKFYEELKEDVEKEKAKREEEKKLKAPTQPAAQPAQAAPAREAIPPVSAQPTQPVATAQPAVAQSTSAPSAPQQAVPEAPATPQVAQQPQAAATTPVQTVQSVAGASAPADLPTRGSVAQAPDPQPAPSVGIPWNKLADGTFNGIVYKGVPFMTEFEKSMVKGVNPDGSFQYIEQLNGVAVVLYRSTASSFSSPKDFKYDPLSGVKFEDNPTL